jgi:hypothetical protein
MTRKSCLLLSAALAVLASSNLSAQQPRPLWTRTYGDGGEALAYSICGTSDGGFAVAGKFREESALGWDIYLLKADGAGDTLWTRTYGDPGDEIARSVIETADGGFLIAGRTQAAGESEWNIYLLKTDDEGKSEWVRTFGRTVRDFACSAIQASSGGYLLAGGTMGADGETYDVYLVKIDSHGDEIWTRTFGGDAGEYATSIAETDDGGYVIAACTESFGPGQLDIYIIRTDVEGRAIWTKTYGGEAWDMPWGVRQTSDGGFIIAGETESFGDTGLDAFIIKTDGSGNTVWERNCGGPGQQCARSVWETPDGSFIVGGSSHIYEEWGRDIYIAKIAAGGDVVWQKTYGGPGHDVAHSIIQAVDGDFVIAGETASPEAGEPVACLIKIRQ